VDDLSQPYAQALGLIWNQPLAQTMKPRPLALRRINAVKKMPLEDVLNPTPVVPAPLPGGVRG